MDDGKEHYLLMNSASKEFCSCNKEIKKQKVELTIEEQAFIDKILKGLK